MQFRWIPTLQRLCTTTKISQKAGVESNADGKLDIGSLDDFKQCWIR